MRHRLSVLLATTLLTGAFVVLSPTRPASGEIVCGGTGTMTVGDPGMLYPVGVTTPMVTPKTPGAISEALVGQGNPAYPFEFRFTPPAGVCVHTRLTSPSLPKFTFDSTGTVKGYCGLSSGRGITAIGDLFAWVGLGGLLVLTGHMIGVINVVPNRVYAN